MYGWILPYINNMQGIYANILILESMSLMSEEVSPFNNLMVVENQIEAIDAARQIATHMTKQVSFHHLKKHYACLCISTQIHPITEQAIGFDSVTVERKIKLISIASHIWEQMRRLFGLSMKLLDI